MSRVALELTTEPAEVADVGQRAGEPVELDDDEHASGAACGQRLAQAGPGRMVPVRPVGEADPHGLDAEAARAFRWAVRSWPSVEARA